MTDIIIAIDGLSSTGKGTFAKRIASALDIPYLDSGAMYRAITLYGLRSGIIEWNGEIDQHALQEALLLNRVELSFVKGKDGESRIFLGDEDVSLKVREMDVARNVSPVSAIPFVRNFVDEQLHRLGSKGCVMDGRDIGTAVFPNADLKIFMVADASVRARRRVLQMEESGQKADYEEILKNVQERDFQDSHRAFHPLRKAEDAIELDNSDMTVDQQMVWLDAILRERFSLSVL
ncbi:MAG: (d)CMP kinase [Bacteroidales bacterium]|nr:(d)CMP kinase [Candidatus Cacconaster merdequi]